MARTVVIIQARMSSTRLPGKTLMELGGRPVIDHVVDRVRRVSLADAILVATTTDASDDTLVAHLVQAGVPYIRGSLDDVLDRYRLAAEASEADRVVRITADCPLIDPAVIDAVIAAFGDEPEVDYCGNTLRRTYPIGMDTEVFTRSALERAHAGATRQHEREHVTPYLYQHPRLFRLRNVEAPEWAVRPDLRLTVDEPADLEMLRKLGQRLSDSAGLREILTALDSEPALRGISDGVVHRHVEKPTEW